MKMIWTCACYGWQIGKFIQETTGFHLVYLHQQLSLATRPWSLESLHSPLRLGQLGASGISATSAFGLWAFFTGTSAGGGAMGSFLLRVTSVLSSAWSSSSTSCGSSSPSSSNPCGPMSVGATCFSFFPFDFPTDLAFAFAFDLTAVFLTLVGLDDEARTLDLAFPLAFWFFFVLSFLATGLAGFPSWGV